MKPPILFKTMEDSYLSQIPQKSLLKLIKDLKPLTLKQDNTRRLEVTVIVTLPAGTSETVTINFIILIEAFGDGSLGNILKRKQTLVKDDNIFRRVSGNYPPYKQFH